MIFISISLIMSFPGGSVVKNPPANAAIQVWSLGLEGPLEKEIASPSSILAWEIPWTAVWLAGYNPWGPQKSQTQLGD